MPSLYSLAVRGKKVSIPGKVPSFQAHLHISEDVFSASAFDGGFLRTYITLVLENREQSSVHKEKAAQGNRLGEQMLFPCYLVGILVIYWLVEL